MQEVRLTQPALDFILHASRSTFPQEFAGLLRKNRKGEIAEVLVIPQSVYGDDFSSINLWNVPYTSRHCGSVHSHPGWSARPSEEDIDFFKMTGTVHIIACRPFIPSSVRAFDQDGKELAIKIARTHE